MRISDWSSDVCSSDLIMTPDPETLPGSMPVAEAAQFFAEGSVHRSYPVIDEQGRLIGLVSRTDALRWRIEGTLPDASLAEHISDASLPTAYPETPCALIADMMVESGIGRVPIVRSEEHTSELQSLMRISY